MNKVKPLRNASLADQRKMNYEYNIFGRYPDWDKNTAHRNTILDNDN
jgi:hypothetical protein